eukprot:2361929-Prymnesium_polylepis.1
MAAIAASAAPPGGPPLDAAWIQQASPQAQAMQGAGTFGQNGDVVMEEVRAPGQGGSVQGSASHGVLSTRIAPSQDRLAETLYAWLRPASTVPSEFPASNTELECSVNYCYTA